MSYKSAKYIRVDYWQVAVFYRFWQFIALLVTAAQLYYEDAWALAEEPLGTANGWGEEGTMRIDSDLPVSAYASAFPYCDNSTYNYAYSSDFVMDNAYCEPLFGEELSVIGSRTVFFTTAQLETHTFGWPCNDPSGTGVAECEANGGANFSRVNGQCGCIYTRTVFPAAVESMVMAFEHTYDTSSDSSVKWHGSSAVPDDSHPLDTRVNFANESSLDFKGGSRIAMTIREWLDAAGAGLDLRNEQAFPDYRDGATQPFFRNTGLNVKIEILYSNKNRGTGRATASRYVYATANITAESGTWARVSASTEYIQHPSQVRTTPQHFHLVHKQRQGVNFLFVTR